MKTARRLFLVVSAILLIRLYTGGYDELLAGQVRKYFKAYSVPCEFASLSVLPVLRPTFKQLRCSLSGPMISNRLTATDPNAFLIDEVSMSFQWLKLLQLKPTFRIYGSMLGGLFDLSVGRSFLGSQTEFEVSLGGTKLERLAQPNGLRLGGELYGVLKAALTENGELSGKGKLELTKGVVSTSISGGQLQIAAIKEIEFSAPLVIEKGKLIAKPLSGGSNQGEVGGEITAMLSPSDLAVTYSAQLDVTLSSAGLKSIGPFLAVAANKDVSKPTDEWLISITGRTPYTPNFQVREK